MLEFIKRVAFSLCTGCVNYVNETSHLPPQSEHGAILYMI